jgi:FAD/FMN-containing dehydrogenase
MGAGLGGGHGRLQGFHGLILDNMIDANVVLADGSQILVSNTSYPDLWWGLRGAGHNFGIVTRFTYKIYDLPSPERYYALFTFGQDKLEQVFTEINTLMEAGLPPEIGCIFVNYAWMQGFSTTAVRPTAFSLP